MFISKVQIKNFRSLRDVTVYLRDINVLIGPNNSGKTAFLEALNFAIGWKGETPQEDDFYVVDGERFDPKEAEPIQVILEFREGFEPETRFSEQIEERFGGRVFQYDQDVVRAGNDPIRYVLLQYEYAYDAETGRYVERRKFLDQTGRPIEDMTVSKSDHLSFFPYFYLETLRDIKKEVGNRASFWGKLKDSVDYSSKAEEITALVDQLNQLLVSEARLGEVTERLKSIQSSLRISTDPDNIYLQAISKRSWELLEGLSIYLKTANSNIALPIDKHGMGTQNIATLTIFNAYLELLLPELIQNEETTPIIGIEEPEAHVYPHSQRAVFEQLQGMKGQKIVSTHSSYIVDQADVYDYVLFRNVNGETQVKQVPQYKAGFTFKYGLPQQAYAAQAFFREGDLHMLRRYIRFKNTELLFSTLFLMCEGDSEKIFFEMIAPRELQGSLGRYGISIIACDGRAYTNFLRIAKREALDLPWLIFSDGEEDTREKVRDAIFSNGYSEEELNRDVLFLPDGMDFEAYCIEWLGVEAFKAIITEKYRRRTWEIFVNELKEEWPGKEFSEKEAINEFIDRSKKTIFGEYIAEYVLTHGIELPEGMRNLFRKIEEKLR